MSVVDEIPTTLVALRQSREEVPGGPPRRWRWRGDDLIRLSELGVLPAEERFELLNGEIYQLRAPGPLHAFLVGLLRDIFQAVARELGGHVREEKPIRLSEEYDPQPDVAIVRGSEWDYRDRFPEPADLFLVIEV